MGATASVGACLQFCNATFPHVPFFAYHSEAGYVNFMGDPKGRCRCYDSVPCQVVPDGGYNLWSTGGAASCPGSLQRRAALPGS